MNKLFTLDDVKALVAEGRFHHATARTIGVPKLWVYAKDADGFRGYTLVGALPDNDENRRYFASIRHGVSIGAFGAG